MIVGMAIVSSVKYPELSVVNVLWRSIGSVFSLYLTVFFFEWMFSAFRADKEEVEYNDELSLMDRIVGIALITISVLLWA